jgi:hypothetical protein
MRFRGFQGVVVEVGLRVDMLTRILNIGDVHFTSFFQGMFFAAFSRDEVPPTPIWVSLCGGGISRGALWVEGFLKRDLTRLIDYL